MNIDTMDMEEMQARSEAAMLGRLRIIQATIRALVAISPQPQYIQMHIGAALSEIIKDIPEDPVRSWVPDAMMVGAGPLAQSFLDAAQANIEINT